MRQELVKVGKQYKYNDQVVTVLAKYKHSDRIKTAFGGMGAATLREVWVVDVRDAQGIGAAKVQCRDVYPITAVKDA